MRSIWKRVGHRRHAHSLLKIIFGKQEKKSVKRIVNRYRKGCVNQFEIDKSGSALAAPEFRLTDSDHDDYEQDEIDILTV